MQKKWFLIPSSIVALTLQGCVPVAVMGGATMVGSSMVEERGLGGTISDTGIRTAINSRWLQHNPEISENVELSVREGRVLLTGSVPSSQIQIDAVRLAWEVSGVREVMDETKVSESGGFSGYAKDSWITTQLKTKLLFDGDIQSINYTLKTVDGVVYLMGIAQNQQEIDRITSIAQQISGVKDVINYARLKDEVFIPVPTGKTPPTYAKKQEQSRSSPTPLNDPIQMDTVYGGEDNFPNSSPR